MFVELFVVPSARWRREHRIPIHLGRKTDTYRKQLERESESLFCSRSRSSPINTDVRFKALMWMGPKISV